MIDLGDVRSRGRWVIDRDSDPDAAVVVDPVSSASLTEEDSDASKVGMVSAEGGGERVQRYSLVGGGGLDLGGKEECESC